ncbi:ankyrin repeat and SAM domain-containing protein 6-like [Sesamum indicum]|uniref:Ankyrin repeat and SAM domain-containing protein 6-like n=1 Tax=Sesamum indicum TaxID=4182 RepID=A0A8M8V7U2_SESIN|nr:ankyrin repeat and SAM domain-containing protein 6-like [Sesamum indicum]
MATEHQPPDSQISTIPPPTATTTAPTPDPPPLDHPAPTTTAATNPPKRQRRPSVRLGEIGGDPPYEAHQRRPNKTWRFHKDPSFAAKTSKTRPLTNLVNGGGGGGGGGDSNFQDSVELSENYVDFTHRKPKIKKPTKRARTNWNKFDSTAVNNGGGGGGAGLIESTNFSPEENENNNEVFREFDADGSESPLLKEQRSPINSVENMGLQFWDQQRRASRARASESNGVHHNEVNSPEKHNEGNVGVREWLIGLGLVRYAPVFEIHEVDDEVLPMLTLEDLKDMGINAVGSRRKMYSAILKLRKGFS